MVASLVLAAAVAVAAQASAPGSEAVEAQRAEVRRLVRRLDAAQLAQREAAEQALIALGPSILDWLPASTAPASAEVQQRLGRVRRLLQLRQSESTAQPSRVSLSADALPLAQVLAEISRQTGNAILDTRRPGGSAADPKISLNLVQVPFWQALDQTLDLAGLDLYPYGRERGLSIVARTSPESRRLGRAAYSGPFRIEPTSVDARRSLRNPASAALRLALEVSWEPRIHPINIKQRLADLTAVDEQGRALTRSGEAGELEASIQPADTAKEFQLPMPLPAREVRQIASLKGRLTALLPGREETFRFGNLEQAANVEQRVAGATVVLEGVRRSNELREVRIVVRFDRTAGALESYRGWIFQNDAHLESPQGKPLRPATLETTRQTETEMGLAYAFQVPGSLAGYTFVYRTPVSIVSAGFDYELRGIALP
jgi:hypothetical protein